MSRFRIPRFAGALVLASTLVLGACSGGGGNDDASPTTTTRPAEVTGTATLGPITVERAGTAGDLNASDAQAVVDAVNAYLSAAVFTPIATGAAPTGLDSLFTPAAAAAVANTPDIADTGLPEPSGDATATIEPVPLTALTNADGQVVLVTATLVLHLEVPTDDGPMIIDRRGDLVYESVEGQWRVASYNLAVERQLPDPPAPTTTEVKK